MKKPARKLTEKQQLRFAEYFYKECFPFSETDEDSATPWGCPWYWCGDEVLEGDTIEDMARNFYEQNKEEIIDLSTVDEDDEEDQD